jgi:phospholipid transport system substrate-binding protein
MNLINTVSVAALFLSLAIVCPDHAKAGDPTVQVRATVDRVLIILKDPKLKSDAAKDERRAELRKAILPRFDFEEMAKRSLGAEWRRLSPAEQKEFVRLFTELLRDSYVTSIESYRGDRVNYHRETHEGRFAEVRTTVGTEQGNEYMIDYRLHLVNPEWKVYDVVIENISIVNNFRSQFRRILNKSSFKELLQTMRDKISKAEER